MERHNDALQAGGFHRSEPPYKRQRTGEFHPTLDFETDRDDLSSDILHSNGYLATYQVNHGQTDEWSTWHVNATRQPFLDPTTTSVSNDPITEEHLYTHFHNLLDQDFGSFEYDRNLPFEQSSGVDTLFSSQNALAEEHIIPDYEVSSTVLQTHRLTNHIDLNSIVTSEGINHEEDHWTTSDDNTSQRMETIGDLQGENDVCFGMIRNLPVTSNEQILVEVDSMTIPVRLCSPNELLHLDRNEIFGSLEDRIAKILVNIGQHEGINFEIQCSSLSRAAIVGKKSTKKRAGRQCQFLMTVVIFGPSTLGAAVGKYFTKCQMHLQDPKCIRDVPYQNPHILAEEDEVVMTSSLAKPDTVAEMEIVINETDLFSELSSDSHLSLTEAPEEIQTPLYDHQKKALSFMKMREQGWECDGSAENLWVKEIDETGQLMFTNVITELSQTLQPPDYRGGVLADQMGLGKTLTMISHIALNPSFSQEPVKFTDKGPLKCIKSTLIVVPFTLLDIWDTQLKRHLKPNTMKWTRLHGSRKGQTPPFRDCDIVITTFETLVRQRKKHLDGTPDTLFAFSWHRIVLDEAHIIRNRATLIAKACCEIDAKCRWAITGTPIQNRITDFGSLLEFLKVYPFSNPKTFDSSIIKPWQRSGERDVSQLKRLIRCTSICRSKSVIDLPKREDKIHNLEFSVKEREYSEERKASTIQQINNALHSCPPRPGQYINALQRLNELRLICNHGTIRSKRKRNTVLDAPQTASTWTKSAANEAFAALLSVGPVDCSVCCDILNFSPGEASINAHLNPTLTSCFTLTCNSCIHDLERGKHNPKCSHSPPCPSREVICTSDLISDQTVQLPSEGESTKLNALMQSLRSLNGEKSVVFSYWTYTLDLVGALLEGAGISYTRIDGTPSGEAREQANMNFQIDSSLMVILVSITCGGAGLDLTAASRAYLLEPQWNPQMEEQALSRIHRLGQKKEVTTIRYRIRNSYEEKVVRTQKEKRDLAARAFSGERDHRGKDATFRLQEFLGDLSN